MNLYDQRKVRKKFYGITLTIFVIAALVQASLFILNLKKQSVENLQILSESIGDQKKTYLESVVSGCMNDIENSIAFLEQDYRWRAANLSQNAALLLRTVYGGKTALIAASDLGNYIERFCQDNFSYSVFYRNEVLYTSAGASDGDLEITEKASSIYSETDIYDDITLSVYVLREDYDSIIRSESVNIVRNKTLPGNEYIWINHILDYSGGKDYAVRLVHPNLPETEGLLLSTDITDIKGNKPYLKELEGIKADGEVFLDYYFKKMNSDEISHKLSYGKLYKDFNWVIATGVYLDDLDSLIAGEYAKIGNNVSKGIRYFIIFITFLVAVFFFVLFRFEININAVINNYTDRLKMAQSLGQSGWWEYLTGTGKLIIPEETARIFAMKEESDALTLENITDYVREDFRSFFTEKINRLMEGAGEIIQFPIIASDGAEKWIWLKSRTETDRKGQVSRIFGSIRDITSEKKAELEKEKLISELQDALDQIRTMGGLIPICSSCKKIRDDKGYWNQLESYIEKHSDVSFTHGICPDCMKKIYGEKKWFKKGVD
ncbi:MAG: cache domain-containing protein [Spirochaetales bacterium]|nr:cache domain-containing protein [Spirochaetales bacterium]